MRKFFSRIFPWVITAAALWYAFRDIDWLELFDHIKGADKLMLLLGFLLTVLSYMFRAQRWRVLFPGNSAESFSFVDSYRVLVLGFFMNNILPARAGEFVRAHLGSKITGGTRTLVLATIASERLVDGLTISAFFLIFSYSLRDQAIFQNLMYVAFIFFLALFCVLFALFQRTRFFNFAAKINQKFSHKASDYTFSRVQIFINGLTPLTARNHLPLIAIWSLIIWGVELAVYICVVKAFNATLAIPYCAMFLVVVNFSSLIPSAPGGIGVIEAITTAFLASIGIEKEHALSMVMSQHLIQYLVVGLPGALFMLTWKGRLREGNGENFSEAHGSS